ncbi:MAG: hypothetical protein HC854_01840 [Flavobacterium sp.]|nr:hypothetical protein [Flavobacterium sp.]
METHNNASQTLFRMVSVRNPKLTETNRINLGFIQRPIGATGFFDQAVKDRLAQSSKMAAMTKAGLSFKTLLGSENEMESGIYAQLLIIGRKISKREILSKDEIKFTKDYYNSLIDPKNKELNKKSIFQIANLWDNLIYQVVTQKDFYVKEAICHILKAIHIGFAQSINKNTELTKFTSEQLVNQGLNATIVLPKELFTEQVDEENISIEKSLTINDEVRLIHDAQKNIEVQNNILAKVALVKLNNELKAIEETYFNQKTKLMILLMLHIKKKYSHYLTN